MLNPVLSSMLTTGVGHDSDGNAHNLHSQIDPAEGEFLQRIVRTSRARRSIEIGCAYGISSLFICDALAEQENPEHLVIDPYESSYWHGVGSESLKRAGFEFARVVERPSECVLPELIEAGEIYDLAFIDGGHEFQHIMTDLLLVNRVIGSEGVVVIDDWLIPSVKLAVKMAVAELGFEVCEALNPHALMRSAAYKVGWKLPRLYSRVFPNARSSMVALRRSKRDRTKKEIDEILLVDKWDQIRGLSTRETSQKYGISEETLSAWRKNAEQADRGVHAVN